MVQIWLTKKFLKRNYNGDNRQASIQVLDSSPEQRQGYVSGQGTVNWTRATDVGGTGVARLLHWFREFIMLSRRPNTKILSHRTTGCSRLGLVY